MRYILRRSLAFLLAVIVASSLVFFVLRLLPGDAALALAGVEATAEEVALTRQQLGTDVPLVEQYLGWLGRLVVGDFGSSYLTKLPVSDEVGRRLGVTLPLSLGAFVLAVLVSFPLGTLAAVHQHRWLGRSLAAGSSLATAVPAFWVGILLAWSLALGTGWFPAGGFPGRGWASPLEAARSLVLPILTIGFVMAAALVRYVRSSVIEVLGLDHLRTALALGYTAAQARRRHGWRSAAVPLVSILALEWTTSLLGAIVVENVFALPGLGSYLLDGVRNRDYPVVQTIIFLVTVVVLAAGLASDLVQRLLDPRLARRMPR